MKILIFGLNYAPEPIGIGPYSAGLAQFLARRAHEVTIIAGNPYYPEWELADGFDNRQVTSEMGGVTIIRVPHYIPENPSGVKRIAHHLSYARNAHRAARDVASADLVLAIAPALLAAPVALAAAKKRGAVSWLHIQDFEVEAALATGLLSQGPAGWLARRFERAVISRFDWVSAISDMMVKKAYAKGARRESTVELRNWSEISIKPSAADVAMRQKLEIPPGLIVLYSGNLALKQGCGLIAQAAQLLADRSDIQFVVCGTGPARSALEMAAESLANLHIRDLQPRDQLGELLSLADIHMLTQIEGAADLVLPSKLSNMLASGRPVVATAAAGTGLAKEVAGCGIVTAPGDARAFAGGIETLADDAALRLELGQAAADRARERWDAAVLLQQFAIKLEQAAEDQGRL